MAYKGTKQMRVSLPRRTKRRRRPKAAPTFGRYVHKRCTRSSAHISALPDDILLQIFSYFKTNELFYNLRPVCRRWRTLAMAPTLWKEIDVSRNVPTNTLIYWIKSAPLLNSFTMKNRNDTNIIAEELSRNCRQLESIKVQNCWGSTKSYLIHSTPLCNLVTRCSKLYSFNFTRSRFMSKKFFRLISRDQKNGKIMKKCRYVGPMTEKQMKALFAALRNYEVHDTATIGNVDFTQRFKLRDIIQYLEELHNPRQIVADVWDNLNYGDEVVVVPINQLDHIV